DTYNGISKAISDQVKPAGPLPGPVQKTLSSGLEKLAPNLPGAGKLPSGPAGLGLVNGIGNSPAVLPVVGLLNQMNTLTDQTARNGGRVPTAPASATSAGQSQSSKSEDPNDKIGPGGFGPQAFVSPSTLLPYRIDFENQATATAPAQTVTVTDQLDPNL